ncbi:MAG TPA: hypothetical protein VN764_18260, partial [Polyangiaceae bacterium]|nr:hypothetical protein [Polyangiaceae bacterium]
FQSARAMKAAVQKVRAGIKDIKTLPPPKPPSLRPSPLRALSHGTTGYTLTGDETEKDNVGYAALFSVKPPARVLIGLLAAGVLATFILVVAQTNDQHPASAQQVTIRTQVPSGAARTREPRSAEPGPSLAPPALPSAPASPVQAPHPADAAATAPPRAAATTSDSALARLGGPAEEGSTDNPSSATHAPSAGAGAPRTPTPSASYPSPPASESSGRSSGTVTEDSIFGSRF